MDSIGWLIDGSSDWSSINLIRDPEKPFLTRLISFTGYRKRKRWERNLKIAAMGLRLNDADHTAELVRRETVDVEAQLASLIVVHGSNRVFLVAVVDGSRRNFIFHCGVLLFPARFSRRSQRRNENCRQEKWRRIYINQSNDQAIDRSTNQADNQENKWSTDQTESAKKPLTSSRVPTFPCPSSPSLASPQP